MVPCLSTLFNWFNDRSHPSQPFTACPVTSLGPSADTELPTQSCLSFLAFSSSVGSSWCSPIALATIRSCSGSGSQRVSHSVPAHGPTQYLPAARRASSRVQKQAKNIRSRSASEPVAQSNSLESFHAQNACWLRWLQENSPLPKHRCLCVLTVAAAAGVSQPPSNRKTCQLAQHSRAVWSWQPPAH